METLPYTKPLDHEVERIRSAIERKKADENYRDSFRDHRSPRNEHALQPVL